MVRWLGISALLFGLSAPAVLVAGPQLTALSPIGSERGRTVTVTLAGQGFTDDLEILSKVPGTAQLNPIPVNEGKPAFDGAVNRQIDLTIPADAAVGIYPIRVRTPDGVTGHLLFAVGSLPDVAEAEPNNLTAEAQQATLGTSIHGQLDPADRDRYRLDLAAGTRLVVEVEARRLGIPIDSALTVLDDEGRELAVNDDAHGLGSDSRVDITIAKAGMYQVVVNDVTFRQQGPYRLKIGSFDYAGGIFPLGGPRAAEAKVWTWGTSRPTVEPVVFSTANTNRFTMVQPMGDASPALPFRFVVSDADEMLVPEGEEPELASGRVVNGRIDEAGDVDRFRLATAPGQRWRFRLSARQLGSFLDGVIAVENKDRQPFVRSVDQVDPTFDFTVPADTNEVWLAVEDLHGRGGPGFGYRLRADRLADDFSLIIDADVVNIPAGSIEYVPVRVDRLGYDGPIQLYAPESVPGITAELGLIPKGQNEGYILLSALPGVAPGLTPFEIWGRGGTPARPIDRRASLKPASNDAFASVSVQDPVPAAICRAKPFSVTIPKEPLEVVRSIGASLAVKVDRTEAVTEPVRIVPKVRPPSYPNGLELTIEKDKGEGAIGFSGDFNVPKAKGTLVLEAITTIAGREERLVLPPIVVSVVEPYAVQIPEPVVRVQPTGSGLLVGVVQRKPSFQGAVQVRVDDLPAGMTAETITVPPEQSAFTVVFQSSEVALGDYTVKLIGSAEDDGRKRTKDYEIPPVSVRLTVQPKPEEAKADETEPAEAKTE